MSQARAYQKLWFADGLSFACTQCGRCCYGASQRQVRLNEAEQQAATEHLKTSKISFINRFMISGTDRLKANDDGSCVLLDKGKCSIHPVRPTQCATYPFWSPHLASEVDWRATAATCEGITPQSRCKSESTQGSSGEPSAARAKQSAVQLIDEFRTSPQAGHGVTPPGKISPAQVVKALIMNELHANGEIPETAEHCEELLSSALQGSELQETIDEVASTQRRVVHEDDHIIVLDSRIDDQWQRDVVLASSPTHTQSCVLLNPGPGGEYTPVHSQLPSSTPVFQMLAACVPGLWWLRDEKHPVSFERRKNAEKPKKPKHARKFDSALADDSPLYCVGPMNIAVIGAGACSVPAHLVQNNDDVVVHAVDIDERMLHAARQHMGVKVNKSLKLFHADGLDFIRSDFDTSNPSTHSYDVIMLDVAVSAKEGSSGPAVVSPAPEFLGDRFLGDAVWRRLRPDGMLMINALGPEEHLTAIEDVLSRHAHVFRWHLSEGSTTVFLALPTTAPSPESVQLEGWDNVWGKGDVPYWDPKLVDEADIIHSILPFSEQKYSVVRDVKVWKAQNYKPVPLVEEALVGLAADGRVKMKLLGG